MLKAVIDSNVFTFFYPKLLIAELRNAPSKPRLAAKVTPAQVNRLIDLLERKGILTEPEQIPPVSRDPKDDALQ